MIDFLILGLVALWLVAFLGALFLAWALPAAVTRAFDRAWDRMQNDTDRT